MLYIQFQTAYTREGIFHFLLKISFIIRKLPAKACADLFFLFCVCDLADPSKHYYAADIERPLALFSVALVHHAVTYFIALCNCIKLMTFLRTMKV